MKQTYFPHDSNARNDIKIIKVRQKLGFEGYGIYFAVLEILFSEKNYLCIDEYETLAFALNCDLVKLKAVIEDFDLFIIKDKCFYSRRLNDTLGTIYQKSEKARENALKRWNKANVEPLQSHGNAIKVNESKEDKIKVNKIKQEKNISNFKNEIDKLTDFDKKDQEEFFLYWSELNKSNTKMRWELERTWSLKRRLQRWCNNGFSKSSKDKFPDYWDKEFSRRLDDEKKRAEYYKHLKSKGWETKYSPSAGMVWSKKK
tara:strand:+ start:11645 stop:12418 length:774 start_codon:yes stop_codon:yes gene_type:complete